MKLFLLAITILAITGCKNNQNKEPFEEQRIMTEPDGGIGNGAVSPAVNFARNIEQAHNKEMWEQKTAVAFDIDLELNGKSAFSGKITSLIDSKKLRIDQPDGTKIVYDGEKVYLCPSTAEDKDARYNIFTWQNFFALPFKLTNENTNLELLENSREGFYRGKLSFTYNTGDTPQDWFIVYQEPETGMLHAAAYLINSEFKEGEQKNPQAIVFRDYVVKESVPVATTWTFHNWNEQNGIGEKTGQAKITNIVFFDAKANLFDKPDNFKIVEK